MANAYDIRRAAERQIRAAAEAQIRQGLTRAYTKAIEEAAQRAQDVGDAFKDATEDGSYRERMFTELGTNAQRSMLAAYDQLVTRREGPANHTHYRQGQNRLSGGILRSALASTDFFTATPDGLEFGDTVHLDSAAAHWHRINFGAGARGTGTEAEFPVSFGSTATALGLEEGPSPGFALPPGLWLGLDGNIVRPGAEPRGADQFYPQNGEGGQTTPLAGRTIKRNLQRARPNALRPTQGIEATNFMDAGIRRIANDIPKLYEAYVDDLVDNAVKTAAKKSRTVEIVQGPVEGKLTKLSLP